MEIGFHARVTEGSGQNGIEVACQHGESIGWNRYPLSEIAIGAPVEFLGFDVGSRCSNDSQSLKNYLLTNAVPGNHGDAFSGRGLRAHGRELNTSQRE